MTNDERERFERFRRFEEWESRQAPPAQERTVGELYAEWVEGLSGLALRHATTRGRHIHRPFRCRGEEMVVAALTPSQCTPVVLQAWILMLAATKSTQGTHGNLCAGSVDQIRMSLQSMFRHFVKLGELAANPLRAVARDSKRDRQRQGYYTAAELERFCAALPPIGAYILRHCYRTCCRATTIRELRKHQIDWESRELVLTVKGGKQARIPVPDATLEELRALCAVSPSEWVYPHPSKPEKAIPEPTLQRWIRRARKVTGLVLPGGEAPNIHHARHGGAVALLDAGADLTDVQVQLVHSSIQQTARYLAMRDRRRTRLREFLNKIR